MAYMRDQKNIQIKGSVQKQKLRNMGYFHGYKGYRFYGTPNNLFQYTDFDEIQAVYDFDMNVKTIVYPQIMFAETALKNYALEVLIDQSGSEYFADVYSKVLDDYKIYSVGSRDYKRAVTKRLNLRNKVYSEIARNYDKNFIVNHYYDKDEKVPIWAIFEMITLGEFGNLLQCANINARKDISTLLKLNAADDADGKLTEYFVFLIKDLRNSVAHNNIVFDTRFKGHSISNRIKNYLEKETGITGISFDTIVDYIVLLAYILKHCGKSKTELRAFIRQFEQTYEKLRASVPVTIYSKIIHTDTRAKLKKLKEFI
jgi:abortive infection bacteriophage resistance protein